MHELGVVFYVIDSVKKTAQENNVKNISSVTVQIGEVTGVIHCQLEDCWNWAVKKEPVMEHAKLMIEQIKAETFCEACKEVYPTVQYGKNCPHCGSGDTYLLTGNEFIVKEITVSDDADTMEDSRENECCEACGDCKEHTSCLGE